MAAKRKYGKSRARKTLERKSPVFDPVAEASDESFPASDAPAWPGGATDLAGLKRKKKKGLSS